ncbi:MAG: hypothetical protein PUH29_06890 [Lachnospiraceae bacterium]|nr:hypothetical protein [Lachnospiraceae bacterium]MDY5556076.1 hypothetical protein [Blautia sp.]
MSSDDCDYYKIKIPTSGKYRLIFDHSYVDSSNTYWNAQLYNSYQEAFSWHYIFKGNKTKTIEEPEYLKKGTYYIKVYNYYYNDGQYAFVLEHYPHVHTYTTSVNKATISKNGTITKKCTCGKKLQTVIYYPKTVSLSSSTYKYDGKDHRPSVKVVGSNKKIISPSNYTVKYPEDVKSPGKHTIQIVFKNNYSGTIKKSYSIVKK